MIRNTSYLFSRLDCRNLTCVNLGSGPYWSSQPVLNFPFKELISVDIWKPYIEHHKNVRTKARLHRSVLMDVRDIRRLSFHLQKRFDIVMGEDILEHLPKEDGLRLLKDAESVCDLLLLWFIPVEKGVHRKIEKKWEDNPYQKHISFWTKEDMEKLGYEIDYLENYHKNREGEDGSCITFDAMWCHKYVSGKKHTRNI